MIMEQEQNAGGINDSLEYSWMNHEALVLNYSLG